MQHLSGNQRLYRLTSLMNMSLVLRLPHKIHLCGSSSNGPRLPSFLDMLQTPHALLTLAGCQIPCPCCPKKRFNVQKCSEHVVSFFVLLLFWLRHVLRATAGSHPTIWLCIRRSGEPTFRSSGATNHWKKHNVSRRFFLFVHLHLLSSDSFSSLIFFLLLFSDSSHLCFSLLFHLSILLGVDRYLVGPTILTYLCDSNRSSDDKHTKNHTMLYDAPQTW